MISVMANMPVMTGTSPMPSWSSSRPNVNRSSPTTASMPIQESHSPMRRHQQAFAGRFLRQRRHEGDADRRQREVLRRPEGKRDIDERFGDRDHAQDGDDGGEKGSADRKSDGDGGAALPGHRMAVVAGCGGARFAGHVQEDRRERAAAIRSDRDRGQRQQRGQRIHRERERNQQRHRRDRTEPRDHADKEARARRQEHDERWIPGERSPTGRWRGCRASAALTISLNVCMSRLPGKPNAESELRTRDRSRRASLPLIDTTMAGLSLAKDDEQPGKKYGRCGPESERQQHRSIGRRPERS